MPQIFDSITKYLVRRRLNQQMETPEAREQLRVFLKDSHNPLGALFQTERVTFEDTDEDITMSSGSAVVHFNRYTGESPYVIFDDKKQLLFHIEPGQLILDVHLIENAEKLKDKEPIARTRTILLDLLQLAEKLRSSSNPELANAPMIGISHIGGLMERFAKHANTQMTWDITGLPQPVIDLAVNRSQLASDTFGGTRKVQASDLKIVCFTADQLTVPRK